jgi:hypothetical protein
MDKRVIFIGDFSGLSLFLSRGVAACGYKAELYSNGDGWKGIPSNKKIFKQSDSLILSAWNQIKGAQSIISSLSSHDTLVLSTEFLFNRWVNAYLIDQLMNKAGRTVLLHAGCSDGFHRIHNSELLCKNCKEHDLKSEPCVFENKSWPGLSSVLSGVDIIVPFTNLYNESSKLFEVPTNRVSMPLNFPIDFDYLSGVICKSPQQDRVIHGYNRPGFKGTAYLNQMFRSHPSFKQNIKLLPRMPFTEFISRLNNADIVIDQLFGGGYGMTGALALAMGTSVAYGYTASQPAVGFDGPGCLAVKISGDVNQDAYELEKILQINLQHLANRKEVVDAARDRHDNVKIGKEFLSLIG